MNDQSDPAAHLRALGAAIAITITTATGLRDVRVTVDDLLGDTDPLAVVSVLAAALHATLGAALGADGRRIILRELGLDVAQGGGQA